QAALDSEERTDSAPHPAASAQQQADPSGGYDPSSPTQYAVPNAGARQQQQAAQFPQYQQAHYPQQGQYPYQQPQQPQQQDPNLPRLRPDCRLAQRPAQPQGRQYGRAAPGGVTDLSGGQPVRAVRRPPTSGWRKAGYRGSGKLIDP